MAALTLAALGILLMITLYIGGVIALLYGTCAQFYEYTRQVSSGERSLSFGAALWHTGLLAAGLVAVGALCRPILTRMRRSAPSYQLMEEDQPVFFEFLRRICRATGAAMPREVYADCKGNAAAALHPGLSSLWSKRVSLHIGLPLVGGLSTREFAGVIAHETGHFAQDFGMRVSFLIRSLVGGMARNYQEADEWDQFLDAKIEHGSFPTRVVSHVLVWVLWVARGVSWLLWRGGQVLSSHLLRQMEFLSDGYESAVAGSEVFEETGFRVTLLETSEKLAQRNLAETFKNGRLPDDYPGYVLGISERFTGEQIARFHETLMSGETRWDDSHPAFSERVRAVHSTRMPGIYHIEEPAELLFRDFERLCRFVTVHHYRERLGLTTDGLVLVPTAQMLQESMIDDAGLQLLFDTLGEAVAYMTPVHIPDEIPRKSPPTRSLEEFRGEIRNCVNSYIDARERLDLLLTAKAFADHDMRFPEVPETENLPKLHIKISAAQFHAGEMRRRAEFANEELGRWFRQRIDRLPGEHREHAEALAHVLNAVSGAAASTHEAMRQASVLFQLMENIAHYTEYELILRKAGQLSLSIRELLDEGRARLMDTPYPYEHVKEEATLADYATRPDNPGEAKIIQAYQAARHQADRLSVLYLRLMQDLVLFAVRGHQMADAEA